MNHRFSGLSVLVLLVAFLILLVQFYCPTIACADTELWINTGGKIAGQYILSLAYDPGGNVLYGGASSGGVWIYKDGEWTNTGGPISGDSISSMVFDPVRHLLYASVVREDDGKGVWAYDGVAWKNTGGAISDSWCYSLAWDSRHDLVYAGVGGGIYSNDGDVWTKIDCPFSESAEALACDQTHGHLYVGLSFDGVWRYDGTSWTKLGAESGPMLVVALAYDSRNNKLFAGSYNRGVVEYDGKEWTEIGPAEGGIYFDINALLFDTDSGLLYAGCSSQSSGGKGIWTFDGENWKQAWAGSAHDAGQALAIDYINDVMYAGGLGVWRHGGILSSFYFAEGTCRPNFDTYFCIQNPGDREANVILKYMKGDRTTLDDKVLVPPHSRTTVYPRNRLGTGDDAAHDFSTEIRCTNGQRIVAERPMYFNYKGIWSGGHDAMGSSSTACNFFFAEGSTRPNIDPYFCIQNPGDSPAKVTLTYMKTDGTAAEDEITVEPTSRSTVAPRDTLGTGDDGAHDFSTVVSSDCAIVVERPEYFNYHNVWTGGSVSGGATYASYSHYFAEGSCRPGFDAYLCVLNPNYTQATVCIRYLRGDGTVTADRAIVPPKSRSTIVPRNAIGTGNDSSYDFSAVLMDGNQYLEPTTQPVVIERPEYFNFGGVWTGGSDVLGTVAPSMTFDFAEGTCRPNFETYFTILNPGESRADVVLTYMKTDGTRVTQSIAVPATSRATVHPADVLVQSGSEAADFSTEVTCTNGQNLVVERPEYFDYNGTWTGGHVVMGFIPW